jgi:hypothetical protein
MFRKPTLADIYVKEVSSGLGESLVPVYSPATADVRVGTIGRFAEGEFDRRGHIKEMTRKQGPWSKLVPLAPDTSPSTFLFVSRGSVELVSSGTVSVAGKDLLKARLKFTKDRAVVASFTGVVDSTVDSPRDFDDLLWKLYFDGELRPDEVVVWTVRHANSGTVLINRKSGTDVELSVDPALIAEAISFQGLAVGVQFTAGTSASFQMSGTHLTVGVKVKGLNPAGNDIETRRGFTALEGARIDDYLGSEVPEISSKSVLADVDFSQDDG